MSSRDDNNVLDDINVSGIKTANKEKVNTLVKHVKVSLFVVEQTFQARPRVDLHCVLSHGGGVTFMYVRWLS